MIRSKLVSVLLSTAFISNFTLANEQKNTQQLVQSAGERSAQAIKKEKLEDIIQEALKAFQESQDVLFLLAHGKIKEAKEKLKQVQAKLKHLKSQYKGKLDKLPIAVVIAQIEGIDDIKLAKKLLKEAKKACEENDIPKARNILEALRNEIQIQTSYLPLEVYTDAINLAQKFIDKGDIKSAINTLNVAIGSIELEEVIIPKPLAEAIMLVSDAKKRFATNPVSAKTLLEEAKRKVKLAQALGYVKTEKEIKPLLAEIERLEEKVEKETAKRSLFESLEKHLKELQSKNTTKKDTTSK